MWSAAFGVPSEVGEEDIMVCLVPVEGRSVDAQALLDFLRQRLPKYALPSYLEVLDELPKTGTHRVIKADLVDEALEGHHDSKKLAQALLELLK